MRLRVEVWRCGNVVEIKSRGVEDKDAPALRFTGSPTHKIVHVSCYKHLTLSAFSRFIYLRDDLVEDRRAGAQHAADVRMAQRALLPEDHVLLQRRQARGARRLGHRLQLGEGLLETIAAVDVHENRGVGESGIYLNLRLSDS